LRSAACVRGRWCHESSESTPLARSSPRQAARDRPTICPAKSRSLRSQRLQCSPSSRDRTLYRSKCRKPQPVPYCLVWHLPPSANPLQAVLNCASRLGLKITPADASRILEEASITRPHMNADNLGRFLGLTYAVRNALRITTIGAKDVGKRARKELRKRRDRLAKQTKRRASGVPATRRIRGQLHSREGESGGSEPNDNLSSAQASRTGHEHVTCYKCVGSILSYLW